MSLIPLGILAAAGAGGGAADAYDLLETEILASNQASVTFTGLGSYTDYKHLQIRYTSRGDRADDFDRLEMTFNGDTGANYGRHVFWGSGGAVTSADRTNGTEIDYAGFSVGANAVGGAFGAGVIDILDFSSTSKNTTMRSLSGMISGAGDTYVSLASGFQNNTNAVTSIEIASISANFISGSRFSLYGIKAA